MGMTRWLSCSGPHNHAPLPSSNIHPRPHPLITSFILSLLRPTPKQGEVQQQELRPSSSTQPSVESYNQVLARPIRPSRPGCKPRSTHLLAERVFVSFCNDFWRLERRAATCPSLLILFSRTGLGWVATSQCAGRRSKHATSALPSLDAFSPLHQLGLPLADALDTASSIHHPCIRCPCPGTSLRPFTL